MYEKFSAQRRKKVHRFLIIIRTFTTLRDGGSECTNTVGENLSRLAPSQKSCVENTTHDFGSFQLCDTNCYEYPLAFEYVLRNGSRLDGGPKKKGIKKPEHITRTMVRTTLEEILLAANAVDIVTWGDRELCRNQRALRAATDYVRKRRLYQDCGYLQQRSWKAFPQFFSFEELQHGQHLE